MSLREKINEALKDAMRAREMERVAAIRLIVARMKDQDINARPSGNAGGIGDAEILSMMQGMVKQRRESIAMFEQGKRPDLVAKEQAEIAVIESFLPRQMDDAAIGQAIEAAIAATGASSVKDMGRIMAELKAKFAGQMDFSRVGPLVKEKLA